MRKRLIVCWSAVLVGAAVLPSCRFRVRTPAAPLAGNGIYVGDPKVYDDASLEVLLRAAQARVAQLNGFDLASITKNLGAVQGATASQSQLAGQVTGLPVQGATAQAVNPNAPAQANLPSFTLPSTFSPSAADIFSEQTQLNFQMTSLQLMLEGALSDQFLEGTRTAKRRVTLGFPITISTPPGFQYQHAVAEVEVSVCNPPGTDLSRGETSNPSLVNIIPREKTYNVASIVSKTTSISGGAIAGVVNFGGGFLRGRQTYYLVQDQDTLAIPMPPRSGVCTAVRMSEVGVLEELKYDSVTFAWQFRPVLGQKVVRDGTRQTFAQIAMPPALTPVACSAAVHVRSRWRFYDPKTGRVGDAIPTTEREHTRRVASFDLPPKPNVVEGEDNGDGTITVRAKGSYRVGTRVRVGSQILDAANPLFEQNPTYIKFTAPAASLALIGAKLVDRDGVEADVVNSGAEGPKPTSCEEVAAIPIASPAPKPDQAATAAPPAVAPVPTSPAPVPPTPAPAKDAALEALTDSSSVLTLTLGADDQPGPGELPVVVIGAQVFGLRNAPFLERTANCVKLIVANDLLRTNKTAKWVRIFNPNKPRSFNIPKKTIFAISGVTLLAAGVPGPGPAPAVPGAVTAPAINIYAITGSHLDALAIKAPSDIPWSAPNTATIKVFSLPGDLAKNLKNIVVQHDEEAPIVLALPDVPAASATPPTPPKPSIDPQPDAGVPASSKTLTLTGAGMKQVIAVLYNATPLPFTAATDKALTINQVPVLAPPGITLVFVYADKSLQPYFVPVAAVPPGR